jgi:hypothetical protein
VNVKSDYSGFLMIYSWKFFVLGGLRDDKGGFEFSLKELRGFVVVASPKEKT